jgi:predicted Ser/Thr protein kinase
MFKVSIIDLSEKHFKSNISNSDNECSLINWDKLTMKLKAYILRKLSKFISCNDARNRCWIERDWKEGEETEISLARGEVCLANR